MFSSLHRPFETEGKNSRAVRTLENGLSYATAHLKEHLHCGSHLIQNLESEEDLTI